MPIQLPDYIKTTDKKPGPNSTPNPVPVTPPVATSTAPTMPPPPAPTTPEQVSSPATVQSAPLTIPPVQSNPPLVVPTPAAVSTVPGINLSANPADMTSDQRIATIQLLLQKRQRGEDLSVEELRFCITCIGADRAAVARTKRADSKSAKKASADANVIAPSLDSLI